MKLNVISQYALDEAICLMAACLLLPIGMLMTSKVLIGIVIVFLVFTLISNIKFAYDEIQENKLKFCLLDSDAMLPTKRKEDAGYDIYACFSGDWMNIKPHETVMIPTGIASVFDPKYVAVLKERGSTGTKGIGQRCGVIDSGFRDNWMVPVTNHNDIPIVILKEDAEDKWLEEIEMHGLTKDDFIIYPYNKAICQMLLLPVPEVEVVEISRAELEDAKSERGKGKLGSSGK